MGLLGSLLWLAWPFIRSDIETSYQVARIDGIGIEDNERKGERFGANQRPKTVTAVGSTLDRAEKASYLYVGIALMFSWLLTLLPAVSGAFATDNPADDVRATKQTIDALASSVHQQTIEIIALKDASRKAVSASQATIDTLTNRLAALESKSSKDKPLP